MKNRKQNIAIYILAALLILSLLISGCKKSTSEIRDSGTNQATSKAPAQPGQVQTPEVKTPAEPEPAVPEAAEPVSEVKPVEKPKLTVAKPYSPGVQKLLDDAFWPIKAENWTGRDVGSVELTDIDGKTHKIADYKGKNLIVLSMTTWAPGCKTQLDFLKETTLKYTKDKLAIIFLVADKDYDDPEKQITIEGLKEFFNGYGVDYPIVFQTPEAQPELFLSNTMVPCHYFINPDSTVKLAIQTILTQKYLTKIIDAK